MNESINFLSSIDYEIPEKAIVNRNQFILFLSRFEIKIHSQHTWLKQRAKKDDLAID